MEPEKEPKEKKLNLSAAIVVAALIIGGAIYASNGSASAEKGKSLIALSGVSEKKFKECYDSGKMKDVVQEMSDSGSRAMSQIPEGERGTPYTVLVNKAGVTIDIQGAYPKEYVTGEIDKLLNGTAKSKNITLDPVTASDHILGDINADILIVEYSDLECPYCARFHTTVKDIIAQYGTKVAWVYRHFPLDGIHPNARAKAEASECVASLGGNDAFWKYVDGTFDATSPKTPAFDPTSPID